MNKTIGVVALVLMQVSWAGGDPAVGWRTDWSGKYPTADPPTQWAADRNVVWKTPMPDKGNATPVIIGDRIFVCSEPTNLLCVSKADGKILWTRSNAYADFMTAEEKAQADKDKAEADRIRKEEIEPVQKQLRDVQVALQKLQAIAKTQPDAVKSESAALRQKAQNLNSQLEKLNAELAQFTRWEMPPTEGNNGHSSATPVSDGQVVCVVYNTGVVACYDMEGNRRWIRFIEKCPHNWGHSASPVLAGNRLIVHIKSLVALDLADGKELWRLEEDKWHWGSPVVTRVGEVDVVITELGDVVRLADGKPLARKLAALEYNSPVVVGDVVHFIQHGGKAVRLSPKDDGTIETKDLWTTRPKNDRYYASPVVHDGLGYAVTRANVFSVIDAATGQVVLEKELDLGKGTVYPSIAQAGKHVFVSSDTGVTLVLEPGREYKELARNSLGEMFRCCPVFEGKRMYIRGYKHLYCIGQ